MEVIILVLIKCCTVYRNFVLLIFLQAMYLRCVWWRKILLDSCDLLQIIANREIKWASYSQKGDRTNFHFISANSKKLEAGEVSFAYLRADYKALIISFWYKGGKIISIHRDKRSVKATLSVLGDRLVFFISFRLGFAEKLTR